MRAGLANQLLQLCQTGRVATILLGHVVMGQLQLLGRQRTTRMGPAKILATLLGRALLFVFALLRSFFFSLPLAPTKQ